MTRRIVLALAFGLVTLGGSGACRSGVGGSTEPADGAVTVAMMPKNKGNPYFVSCRQGAEEAAQQLGVKLLWDGPTETDPAKQNDVVEAWITRGVQAIAVSVENREAMSTVLRKARGKGIKVVTWDADADPDARDAFVNQATPAGIADVLLGHAARLAGPAGGEIRHHHRVADRRQPELLAGDPLQQLHRPGRAPLGFGRGLLRESRQQPAANRVHLAHAALELGGPIDAPLPRLLQSQHARFPRGGQRPRRALAEIEVVAFDIG